MKKLSFLFAALVAGMSYCSLGETTGVIGRPEAIEDLTDNAGGTATRDASTSFTSGNAASAFDNGDPSDDNRRVLTGKSHCGIAYTFKEKQYVGAYGIKYQSGGYAEVTRAPKSWKLYGSNDYDPATGDCSQGTWKELDERTNETDWEKGQYRYYTIPNKEGFTSYKIVVTANNGNSSYILFADMEYVDTNSRYLQVEATPFNVDGFSIGKVRCEVGEEFNFPYDAQIRSDAESGLSLSCAGAKVYTLDEGGAEWTLWKTFTSSPVAFTMPDAQVKMVWEFVLSGVPQGALYVSPKGSDENDGTSFATAFASLSKAVTVAGDTPKTIIVGSGTYAQTEPVIVTVGHKIYGAELQMDGAILKNTASGKHVLTVNHEDAEVAFLTFTGGVAISGPACLGIESGLVRDCRITGCSYTIDRTATGGTVLMNGGRLMRSVVDGNAITGTGWNGVFAAGVMAKGGVIENCLIRGNSARAYNDKNASECSALNLQGTSQAINCTVIGNNADQNGSRFPMTTYVASTAKIANSVIFGNTCADTAKTIWAGTQANYVNCIAEEKINETCQATVDPGFVDAANGDYTPSSASVLKDAGSNAAYEGAAVSTTDIKGGARIQNTVVDVGAWEYTPSAEMSVDFTYQVDRRLLPVTATFAAFVENPAGEVTYSWDFDNDGIVDVETQEAMVVTTLTVAKSYDVKLTASAGGKSVSAVKYEVVKAIQKDVYVTTGGSNEYPYATPSTAARTIADALAAADNGCSIFVFPGTYQQASAVVIDKAVSVVSSTTNAEDVTFQNTYTGKSVATVAHEDAELAGVTLTGGSADSPGSALTLSDGLVRDCIITGNGVGGVRDTGGMNGTVCMTGGRLMRCKIVKNDGGTAWNSDCAAGVNASAGIIESCLIATNKMSYWGNAYTSVLGVKLKGTAKAVNCTIVDNVCKNPGVNQDGNGAYPMATCASGSAQFVNCVIWGNVTEPGDESNYVWHGTAADYVNCYAEVKVNDTCAAIADPGFTDRANGDYTLRADTVLRNRGLDYATAGGISETDLAGGPRVVGKAIDIGCYEGKAAGMLLIVR